MSTSKSSRAFAGSKAARYRAVLVRPQRPESMPVEPDAYIADLGELPQVLRRWTVTG